jgi:hypothetical protein
LRIGKLIRKEFWDKTLVHHHNPSIELDILAQVDRILLHLYPFFPVVKLALMFLTVYVQEGIKAC